MVFRDDTGNLDHQPPLEYRDAAPTMLFSVIMDFWGGFLPAVRAGRMKIVNALRAE